MKPHTVDPPPPANSKESNAAAALRNVIDAALTSLGTEQRQMMELACRARLTPGDIAARLGLPVKTINMHLRIGMVALRNQLRPLLEKGTCDPSIPD